MKVVATAILGLSMAASLPFFAGCASNGSQVSGSGFLDDYSKLKPAPDGSDAMVYIKGGGRDISFLAAYDKVMIDPILIWTHPDSEFAGVNPDELKAVTDYFRETLTNSLAPKYPIVSKPGPGVLRFRAAITGLKQEKPKRSAVGYIPIAFVVSAGTNAARSAAGKHVIVVEASLEAQLIDGATNELLGAYVESRKGDKATVEKGDMSWEYVKGALDFWAEKFRKRMDEAHASR